MCPVMFFSLFSATNFFPITGLEPASLSLITTPTMSAVLSSALMGASNGLYVCAGT